MYIVTPINVEREMNYKMKAFAGAILTMIYLLPCVLCVIYFFLLVCFKLWKTINEPKYIIMAIVAYACVFIFLVSAGAWINNFVPSVSGNTDIINLSNMSYLNFIFITILAVSVIKQFLILFIEKQDVCLNKVIRLFIKMVAISIIMIGMSGIFNSISQFIFDFETNIYDILLHNPYTNFRDYAYSVGGLFIVPVCTIIIPFQISKYAETFFRKPTYNMA